MPSLGASEVDGGFLPAPSSAPPVIAGIDALAAAVPAETGGTSVFALAAGTLDAAPALLEEVAAIAGGVSPGGTLAGVGGGDGGRQGNHKMSIACGCPLSLMNTANSHGWPM